MQFVLQGRSNCWNAQGNCKPFS